MKLYGHDTSPYVRRIRVLLAEKGLPFERDPKSWTEDGESQRLNPMLRVPVLRDGEQLLLDSKLIAAYLYQRHPQPPPAPPAGHLPLQPTLWRPEHRWDDENTLHVIDTTVDTAVNLFLLELDGITGEDSAYLGRQRRRIRTCLAWLDDKLAGRSTFGEGAFAFLDLALVCALQWMDFRKRYPVHEHANLARVVAAHTGRASLASTHPSLAKNAAPPKTPSR